MATVVDIDIATLSGEELGTLGAHLSAGTCRWL